MFSGCVYALRRPDGAYTYVGQTTRSLLERLAGHVSASRLGQLDGHAWMKDLLDAGQEPDLEWIQLLDRAGSPAALRKLERERIKDLAADGHPLMNRLHDLGPSKRRFRNRPKYPNGTRIGRLTVLEAVPTRDGSARFHTYRCQCECGNVVTVKSAALGRRHPSCGCWGRELLRVQARENGRRYGGNRDAAYAPGDRVGIWTVVAEHGKRNHKRLYLVTCQHGREQIRSLALERSRPRKSCGCPKTIAMHG